MLFQPYMRRSEWLGDGMPLEDKCGNVVGHCPKIGSESIAKVSFSTGNKMNSMRCFFLSYTLGCFISNFDGYTNNGPSSSYC